jgi:hypothetical protein
VLRPGAFSLCCALLVTPHASGLWAQIALERLPEVSDATAANDPPPVPPDLEQEVQSLRYPTVGEPNANGETGIVDHRVPSGVDRRWMWNPPSTTHPLPRMKPVTAVPPTTSTGNSLRFVLPPTAATSVESR